MAKDNYKSLSDNAVELKGKLQTTEQELRNLKRRVAQQDLKNVRDIKKVRVQIARIKTKLSVLSKNPAK